jgi:O-antigen/teichoic acid export membrane protein
LVFLATIKTLAITKLSSNMQFKEISIALMVKQIVLYSIIITSSFKLPTLTILFLALFITEVIETCMLLIFMKVSKIQFLPSFDAKVFPIDKVSQKFIFFMGFEQIFNVLAQQFPAIFVVFVMGKNLAPEFQLPLYAVSIPASLIIVSVAKVIFPYISEIRDNEKIKTMLISLEFIITLIILPVLIGISFFSKEIVAILFDKSWTNAVIAFRFLPIMIIANVLNNPFTSIAAIKEKPHIIFIYSISLFLCRMLSIFVGYKLLGFKGAILLFVFFDFFIRMIRLKIDASLVKLKFSKFLLNLKNNFLSAAVLFSVSILLFSTFQNKLVSFIVGFIFYVFLSFKLEKERIAELVYKLKKNISIKR